MLRFPRPLRIPALIGVLMVSAALLLYAVRVTAAATVIPGKTKSEDTPTNILLIGQDSREGETTARADTILLCSFYADNRKVLMTSFLRDLYVPIPGQMSNRLNAAYAHGGMSLLRQTLQENFGISIDGCVEVDFSHFPEVLDILGGVTIDLRQDEADVINKIIPGRLTEGKQHLSGEQALAYTRIRNLDSDGDFSRTNRQRKVISALLGSYKGASLFTILSVIPEILPMLSTDLEQSQIISTIIRLLPMLSESTITSQQIPAKDKCTYSTIRGMSVLTADLEEIRSELAQSLLSEK